jgi:YhcH/YjgK/YiaL family protein
MDMTKYGDTKPQTNVTLKPGQFVIFFPQDGHAPCIIGEKKIKKAIFKVKA